MVLPTMRLNGALARTCMLFLCAIGGCLAVVAGNQMALAAEVDRDYFAPADEPDRPRSDIIAPIFSLLLPGLDQWWEGQTSSAAAYTGVAVGSAYYVNAIARANGLLRDKNEKDDADAEEDEKAEESPSLSTKDNVQRKIMLGNQIYQSAGGFSAWHAFRTAASTRQHQGQYEFLAKQETPGSVLLAPFEFKYLRRSSTWIPLSVGLGLAGVILNGKHEGYERDRFSKEDAFFASAYSFNAGTHEEALFRGWMMPVMMEYWQSPFWANVGQSTIFALAHLGNTPIPLAQLLLGYHLGYVSQRNGWTLAEAVFIHTWWDVIAFSAMWHFREAADEETASKLPTPVLWLPPFAMSF